MILKERQTYTLVVSKTQQPSKHKLMLTLLPSQGAPRDDVTRETDSKIKSIIRCYLVKLIRTQLQMIKKMVEAM